jgi:putative aminopeptidase FrvX
VRRANAWAGPGVTAPGRGRRGRSAVDMAAVGFGQTSNEFATTVCVKDATGPYDYGLSRRLIGLAQQHGVDCRTDIYTYY